MEKQFSSQMIRDFFTEDEWDAIYNAMQLSGSRSETELLRNSNQITALFN